MAHTQNHATPKLQALFVPFLLWAGHLTIRGNCTHPLRGWVQYPIIVRWPAHKWKGTKSAWSLKGIGDAGRSAWKYYT